MLGLIEPHRQLLRQPEDDQKLYKVLSLEHFLSSARDSYLHFQRVDCYADFSGADEHDGEQLPSDKAGNQGAKFGKSPSHSLAMYYEKCRSRSYAFCVSMENSDYIWSAYGGDDQKVCIVFNFSKLRQMLNRTMLVAIEGEGMKYGDIKCHQIFSINYGIVDYKFRNNHRLNSEYFPNPIEYTYIKDKKYGSEKELRISLSALGMGDFRFENGSILEFPNSLQLDFDFKAAVESGVIEGLRVQSSQNVVTFKRALNALQLGIEVIEQ